MKKILRHLNAKNWELFGISVIFILGQVWLDLKIPGYMSSITMMVQTEGTEMSQILNSGAMMVLCALGSMVSAIITGFLVSRLAASFSRRLRGEIFNRVSAFSMEEIDGFSTASLITRSTNDVMQLQNFVSKGLELLVRAPVIAVWALLKISGRHWEWTAFTGGSVLVVVGVVAFIVIYAQPRFRKMQVMTDDLNRAMSENLTGIRVVRAYNAEKYQEEKFKEANDTLTANSTQARRAMGVMNPAMKFVNNMLNIGIYCIGAFIIASTPAAGQLEVFSDMVVFSTYAGKIVQAFMSLNHIFMMWPRATVSAERVNEVLDTKPKILDGTRTNGIDGEEGTIEFKNVSFKYPGAEDYILHDISFSVKKGETVAFIGATGSGKTTIVNLMPRFYDASKGEVLIDGINVKKYSLKALHNKMSYVPQKAMLFTGTVNSNIAYGDNGNEDKNEEDIHKAADIALATEFVENMPEDFDSTIVRGGGNVSGGQRQRLSIARAVFRKPEIYIFDDSFSALDYKTDRILREKLQKETSGVTTIIVAQRIGTIRDADKILVVDDGRIVGEGKHQELMNSCQIYREIAYTQLGEEALV